MFFELIILLITFLFILFSVLAGRLKNSKATWAFIIVTTLMPLPLTPFLLPGESRFFTDWTTFCGITLFNFFICFITTYMVKSLAVFFPPLTTDELKSLYKRPAKYLVFVILPTLFITYHIMDQPDFGGNRRCYIITGINPEKDYGGEFLPVYEFMPSPFYNAFRYRMNRKSFTKMRTDLEKKYGQIYEHGCIYPVVIHHIGVDSGDTLLHFHDTASNQVWLLYKPEKELLYLGNSLSF